MKPGKDAVEALLAAPPEEAARVVRGMGDQALRWFREDWPSWAHDGQEAPVGDEWRVWVMLAGRGFGKTRAGAEWVLGLARAQPDASFALVAASADEARRVMVEGPSGLIASAPPRERAAMRWEPSRKRLRFASGAEAFLYSGAHADGLRGPQHHFAWCDELAKWRQAQEAWDNLMLGLRLGRRPRALVTTTPRSIGLLKALIKDEETAKSEGATRANPHLPDAFVASMERQHGGTRFGRQELEGELIEDLEGALWSRELIEACREVPLARTLRRVVVGVDPPASAEGTCGVVACAVGPGEVAYVLADESRAGLSPEGWARLVAETAQKWSAHRVVAEANNGGRMVESVLRGAGRTLPLTLVHASDGKSARAEPVAALFESKQAKLAGRFPALEDQLCGLIVKGGYEGPGRSPDRADAMVWALTELMLGGRAEPRARQL
jgi:phage terminase large subunit-like protein